MTSLWRLLVCIIIISLQLQYLFDQLSSPATALTDFVESTGDDDKSSPPHATAAVPTFCSESVLPTPGAAADIAAPNSDDAQEFSGSTASINELLDSCVFDTENAADAFADIEVADPAGWVAVDDIVGRNWRETDLTTSDYCECDDHVTKSETLPDFLLGIENCHWPRQNPDDIEANLGRDDISRNEGEDKFDSMQQSFVTTRSKMSSSTDGRTGDEGYHSNATSATSPEETVVARHQTVTSR